MASVRSKTARIRETLRLRLRTGQVAPGGRFYSNNSLARDFEVSAPTASKILDELCAEGLVTRVHGSGTYVSDTAQSHRVGRLGMMLRIDFHHPLARTILRYDILSGFERECTEHGYLTELVNLEEPDYEERVSALIQAAPAAVLVLPPYGDPRLIAAIRKLEAARVPWVYWDCRWEPVGALLAGDRVDFDDEDAGRRCVEHLMALGHRQIAYVGYPADAAWQQDRLAGWRSAMAEAPGAVDPELVQILSADDLTPTRLVTTMKRLFDRGVTGIAAASDMVAAELVMAGRSIDRRCPRDYSIVGVDNREVAMALNLTSVDRNGALLAESALKLIDRRRGQPSLPPQELRVSCPLIIRSSTAPPPAMVPA